MESSKNCKKIWFQKLKSTICRCSDSTALLQQSSRIQIFIKSFRSYKQTNSPSIAFFHLDSFLVRGTGNTVFGAAFWFHPRRGQTRPAGKNRHKKTALSFG